MTTPPAKHGAPPRVISLFAGIGGFDLAFERAGCTMYGKMFPDYSDYGVRRLTPSECERLQGFPDGWTEGHSDTARYRMLGNAIAVPVAQWIAKRLIDSERRRNAQ